MARGQLREPAITPAIRPLTALEYGAAARARDEFGGGMQWLKVKQWEYLTRYRRDPVTGEQKATSIGRRSPETEEVYDRFIKGRAELDERMSALRPGMAGQARMAKALRLNRTEAKQQLTAPEVVRQYKARFPGSEQSLTEQTIRNKRPNGNPYQNIYRAWVRVAEAVVTVPAEGVRKDGLILRESDLHTIKDPTLRHQVTLVFAQNRSLHNRLNIGAV